MSLQGKKILIGITGSIAAYRICDFVRELRRRGAQTRCVVTPSAEKLVSTFTLEALSGNPVLRSAFDGGQVGTMPHIDWVRWADLYLIAPCTANTMAELAHGLTNSAVSLCALACKAPVAIVPAMNTAMLKAPATQRNLEQLKQDGFWVLPSGFGELACGEDGEGKFLDTSSLLAYTELLLEETICKLMDKNDLRILSNKSIWITLGHTREPIDAVRTLVNTSSGKTGLAMARAFKLAGANVHLLAGYTSESLGNEWGLQSTFCPTTYDFHQNLTHNIDKIDGLIASAALADFIPADPKSTKIKNSKSLNYIELKESVNVLDSFLDAHKLGTFTLGFALENPGDENLAFEKWKKRPTSALLINTPHSESESGFGKDLVRSLLVHKNQYLSAITSPLNLHSKNELAWQAVNASAQYFKSLRT